MLPNLSYYHSSASMPVMNNQESDVISSPINVGLNLQNYLSSSIQIAQNDVFQACSFNNRWKIDENYLKHQSDSFGKSVQGPEPPETFEQLKSKVKQHEEDKEKLKLIIKEQEELIKQQHSVIEQYQQEIVCLKSVNKSLLSTPYSLACDTCPSSPHISDCASPPLSQSGTYGCSSNPSSQSGLETNASPRDKRNDTRLYKKGWPKSDKRLLQICFEDFIEGRVKYPPIRQVDVFLQHHPEFLSSFNFTDKERKHRLRSQLNNMKRTTRLRHEKLAEQQALANNPTQQSNNTSLPSVASNADSTPKVQ